MLFRSGASGAATGSASPIVVTDLTNTHSYTCTVHATNGVGDGAESSASNAFTPDASVPGSPESVTASSGHASVLVIFDPPTDDGGDTVSSYTALCDSSDGGVSDSASGTESPINVDGLTPGKTYTCTVVATNSIGSGPASAASNTAVPEAPDRKSTRLNSSHT